METKMTELLNVIVELISLLIDTLPHAMFNILVKKKHTYVSIHVYKRKIWLKACLKLRVERRWDLILARISIGRIHGLFDLQPCCIYMLLYSFMTRVEFWIRPDRCPPVHYAETSMKNGFGLKYIHKFLNLPFLLLQVCILWKILPGLIQAFG